MSISLVVKDVEGNYLVSAYSDALKIRETKLDFENSNLDLEETLPQESTNNTSTASQKILFLILFTLIVAFCFCFSQALISYFS